MLSESMVNFILEITVTLTMVTVNGPKTSGWRVIVMFSYLLKEFGNLKKKKNYWPRKKEENRNVFSYPEIGDANFECAL